MALLADGTVRGYGTIMGNGIYDENMWVPSGLSDIVAISAGTNHCLVLKADGTVSAWGDNYFKQCDVPSGLSDVTAIAAGGETSLALKSDGTVVVWGNYRPDSPVTNTIAIAAGEDHCVALKADGKVTAWGSNSEGQLNKPQGLSNVSAIASSSSSYYSIVLKSDGTLVGWRRNNKGQISIPAGLNLAGRLSSLALDRGSLMPAFNPDVMSYSAVVDSDVSSINITAALENASAVLRINGQTVQSTAPAEVELNQWENSIPVTVTTPADGVTRTYIINITREHRPHYTAIDIPAVIQAGEPFDITVSIKDVKDEIITDYTGTVCFTVEGGTLTGLPASYTFTEDDGGEKTFTGAVISGPGSVSIEVSGEGLEPDVYWKMDDGSGDALSDSINGNHGILVNNPQWSTDLPEAITFLNSHSLFLPATAEAPAYAALPTAVSLADKSFTVSFWAKSSKAEGNNYILCSANDKGANKSLHIGFRNTNTFTFAFYSNDLNAAAPADGEWHHWAVSYDKNTGKRLIYCDGDIAAEDSSASPYLGTEQLYIGRYFDATKAKFKGFLDDFRIYYQALPAETVSDLYSGEIQYPGTWYSSKSIFANVYAYSAAASVQTSAPAAGTTIAVSLAVKDAMGNADITFNGNKSVTISGYTAAPDGSIGSFAETELDGESKTIGLSFENGEASCALALNNASSQNILFSIDGVINGSADIIALTPVPAPAVSLTLSKDIGEPVDGGQYFSSQPELILKDSYGNICINDNTTQVSAVKKDGVSWFLTGTKTVAANAGVVKFTDLGFVCTMPVSEAQISFGSEGLEAVESGAIGLPGSKAAQTLVINAPQDDIISGTPFDVTVKLLDAQGQPAELFCGTVQFRSSDASAELPEDYTFTAGDKGIKTFSITLNSSGAQTLTVETAAGDDIKGYWRFDEGTGTTAGDSSAGNRPGVLTGAGFDWMNDTPSTFYTDPYSVKLSLYDYIEIPSGIDLANKSFSISFYAKRYRSGINEWIIFQGNSAANKGLHIGFNANDDFSFAFYSDDLVISTESYNNDANWHQWVLTYDSAS